MADDQLTLNVTARDNASATLRRVAAETKGLGTGAAKAAGPLDTLGRVTGGLVSPATLAIGAIAGVGFAAGASVRAASDLNEEITKSNVVFGDSAGNVQAFAENAEDIGLSERAALGAAGAFGNMFNTTGLAQDASAEMSTTMVQLAADMASFNNQDPADMLEKLRSGLAGEAEPLRQVGVLLSEAAVKTYAYKNSIATSGAELTEAQKVQARYGLILEQTADQQGDVERSGDTLANGQRRVGAAVENLSAQFGSVLLPAVADAANSLADIIETVGDFGDAVGDVFQSIDDFQQGLSDVGDQARETGVELDPGAWAVAIHNWAAQGVNAFNRFTGAANKTSGEVTVSAENMGGTLVNVMGTSVDTAAAELGRLPIRAADKLRENQFHLNDAVDDLREYMENYLTPKEQVSRLKGFLTSHAVTEGLASGKPGVVRQTEAMMNAVNRELDRRTGTTAGERLAQTYAQGISNFSYLPVQVASKMAQDVANFLDFSGSPPFTKSRKLGEGVAQSYGEGLTKGIGQIPVPRLPGAEGGVMARRGTVADGYGGGGVTINFNSTIPPTPAQGQDLARRIGPELKRWMRNN